MADLFEPDAPVNGADMVDELKREIHFRRRVYPRLVAKGRMTQAESDRRIAVMIEILALFFPASLKVTFEGGSFEAHAGQAIAALFERRP